MPSSLAPPHPKTGHMEVHHVNVRCLLDGRKYRIAAAGAGSPSASGSSGDARGGASLGSLRIAVLHRRLAQQTGRGERDFSLFSVPAVSTPNCEDAGRPLLSEALVASIAYVSPSSGLPAALVEMRPFDPADDVYRRFVPGWPTDSVASRSLPPNPPSLTVPPSREPAEATSASLGQHRGSEVTPSAPKAAAYRGTPVGPEVAAEQQLHNAPRGPPPRAGGPGRRLPPGRYAESAAAGRSLGEEKHLDTCGGTVTTVRRSGSMFEPTPTRPDAPGRVGDGLRGDVVVVRSPSNNREELHREEAASAAGRSARSEGPVVAAESLVAQYLARSSPTPGRPARGQRSSSPPLRGNGPAARGGATTSYYHHLGGSRNEEGEEDEASTALTPRSAPPTRAATIDPHAAEEAPPTGTPPPAVEELQYQLEVAEALLQEDKTKWSADLDAFETAQARRVQERLDVALAREESLDEEHTALRDGVYAADEREAAARRENRTVLQHRDSAKLRAEEAAAALDAVRAQLLQRLGGGAACETDTATVDRLLHDLTQKHLHARTLQEVHDKNVDLATRLEAAKYQRRALHHTVEAAKGNIRVVVRMRPVLSTDFQGPQHAVRDEEGSVAVDTVENTVTVTSHATGMHVSEFYRVYGPVEEPSREASFASAVSADGGDQQRVLFLEQVRPVLQSLLDGVNVAVLAYGQTGSGKTYTIFGDQIDESGDGSARGGGAPLRLTGLLPQSLEFVFAERQRVLDRERHAAVHRGSDPSDAGNVNEVDVRLGVAEVYLNEVYDLLAPAPGSGGPGNADGTSAMPIMTTSLSAAGPTTLQSGGVRRELRTTPQGATIANATMPVVTSVHEALELVRTGFAARKTHQTLLNTRSSRSHMLLTIAVTVRCGGSERRSQLTFVDLAGSERVHRSLSAGDRLKEAQQINKSLSALGDVLAALTTPAAQRHGSQSVHVPYRNSKLTHLLQQCLGGGDAKTVLVACVCPHLPHRHNLQETSSTLAFASRARLVRTAKPRQ